MRITIDMNQFIAYLRGTNQALIQSLGEVEAERAALRLLALREFGEYEKLSESVSNVALADGRAPDFRGAAALINLATTSSESKTKASPLVSPAGGKSKKSKGVKRRGKA